MAPPPDRGRAGSRACCVALNPWLSAASIRRSWGVALGDRAPGPLLPELHPFSPAFTAMAMVDSEAVDGTPLSVQELLSVLRGRWQASYDLQLVRRQGRLYLHVMWGHLEQQSFPLTAEAYGEKLEAIVASLNGLGVAGQVRQWITTTRDKPRLGKALSLPLQLPEGRASEFLL